MKNANHQLKTIKLQVKKLVHGYTSSKSNVNYRSIFRDVRALGIPFLIVRMNEMSLETNISPMIGSNVVVGLGLEKKVMDENMVPSR